MMASSLITLWQIDGETMETVRDFIFFRLQNHCRWWLLPWNWKEPVPWNKNCDQPRQHIKKQRHYFANKGLLRQSYGFSNSYVGIWASLVGQTVKDLPAMRETWARSLGQEGEEHGNSHQYSCLENFMDRGAWWATVHVAAKSEHVWVTNTIQSRAPSHMLTF